MAKVAGVKFKNNGKLYYFAPNTTDELNLGDGVIVETQRGVEYGKIHMVVTDVPDKQVVAPLKPIIRKATDADLHIVEKNEIKKAEALKLTEEKIRKHNLSMKLLDCEFTFDCTKIIIYFTAESRIDFRELVKDLAAVFRIRIELRQVGIREETKVVGGLGSCGRVCCCRQMQGDFKKVTIKMAKTQGLSLNPGKISGLCGRLMCCLEYENEHYKETVKIMPKIGSEVKCPDGRGIVLSNNMLNLMVKVRIEHADGDFTVKDYPLSSIKTTRSMAEDIDDSADDEEIKKLLD